MAYNTKDKENIARIQNGLKCSYEEACEIYECDKEIDKGIKHDFDLSAEQEKVAKSFCHTTSAEKKTAPTVYKFDKRERKENVTKSGIISELAEFLANNSENAVENLEITNKERQIAFSIGENKFELTLVQKRTQKKS